MLIYFLNLFVLYILIRKGVFFKNAKHPDCLEHIIKVIIHWWEIVHSYVFIAIEFICKQNRKFFATQKFIFGLILDRIVEVYLDILKLFSVHLHIGNDCFLSDSFFFLFLLSLFFYVLLLALESVQVSLWFFLIYMELIYFCLFEDFVSNRLKWPEPL